ncbi:hypothetical protein F5Y19DRAFT_405582 [Xylariaceae sp. FL1651]|nr:hypothetical protein F5Y19DRAFT_405582 [Xylariaceae sp. FL1651]
MDLNPIKLRKPSKYLLDPTEPKTNTGEPFVVPPHEWIWGKWTVTHSTRAIWQSAKNARITFSPHKPLADTASPPERTKATKYASTIKYEKKDDQGGVKTKLGTETPDPMVPAAWKGRGKGWWAPTHSHWQILGWGERPLASGDGNERWIVAWFQAKSSANEGVDLYCDREQGLSKESVEAIIAALRQIHAPAMVYKIEKYMTEVTIDQS